MTTRGGDRFRARDAMSSTEGLDIHASSSPLFAKLTNCKAQLSNRWIDIFLDFFCKYMNCKVYLSNSWGCSEQYISGLINRHVKYS